MRARNIKPGFFQNEDLAELPPETRLLFVGLWLMADREGRLEDRPRRIKMQIFPADPWDVEPMLGALADLGLIIRYQVDNSKFIAIPAWHRHQNPHVKEKQSTIPAQDEHQTSTGNSETDPADSLIPDSLNPLPPVESADKPRKRPSKRCPADFQVTEDLRAWAAGKHPEVDLDAETEAFRDHEFATAKTDWPATWRSWIRKAAKFSGNGQRGPGVPRKTKFEQIFGSDDNG